MPFDNLSKKLIEPKTNAELPVFWPTKSDVSDKELTSITVLPEPSRTLAIMLLTNFE